MCWEMAFEGDSASVLIYHVERKQLLCVRQFRPAVFARKLMRFEENQGKKRSEIDFANYPLTHGMTLELCGGLMVNLFIIILIMILIVCRTNQAWTQKKLQLRKCMKNLVFVQKQEMCNSFKLLQVWGVRAPSSIFFMPQLVKVIECQKE